ncbi:MAG TPA: DUF4124 domain-containing protein [Noviherbaspirillum sp.]|uniref:DUF4124 domain-containing protein n=1 Tax=Noviherbaspirillum sp. TaxID=1926288 RepID=UPI002B487851|nr:DUF4124 domain-containing protein [Noviherbaspirillum sp.]HJV86266.1 DUF4124 domain-containing protein [Noviherbaspirillum sp.]
MRLIACGSLAVSVLILNPSVASAGINKCTDAAGVVTYSDQPCATQGQQAAEARDSTAFSLLEARENDKKLGETCIRLTMRRNQCYRIDNRLATALRVSCEGPMKRERVRQAEQRYSRYANQRDQSDALYQEQSQQAADCSAFEKTVYKFLRESFRDALSADDIKALEYHFNAVPSDGRPDVSVPRRRYNRY